MYRKQLFRFVNTLNSCRCFSIFQLVQIALKQEVGPIRYFAFADMPHLNQSSDGQWMDARAFGYRGHGNTLVQNKGL